MANPNNWYFSNNADIVVSVTHNTQINKTVIVPVTKNNYFSFKVVPFDSQEDEITALKKRGLWIRDLELPGDEFI